MEQLLPDPRNEYETLAEALRVFHADQHSSTAHALTALQDTVARVTAAWQRCETHRMTREKEFRYHVVRLKLLLAGALQTLETLSGAPLSKAA